MTRGIAEKNRAIRLPLHITAQLNRLHKVQREFSQQFGKNPTVRELSSLMDVAEEEILFLLPLSRPIGSLDLMVSEESNSCLGDMIADPKQDLAKRLEAILSQEWIGELLGEFSEKEQAVIVRRYLVSEPESYRDIGIKLSVSGERVRQIHEKVLQKMRLKLTGNSV